MSNVKWDVKWCKWPAEDVPPGRAYPVTYLEDVMLNHAYMFLQVVQEMPDDNHVDMDKFVTDYMNSFQRAMIDRAHPRWATLPAPELYDKYMRVTGYELPRGQCHMDDDMAYWFGLFYSLYQWYYDLPSSEVIYLIPTYVLGTAYPGLHSMNLEIAIEKWAPEGLRRWRGRPDW